MTTGPTEQLISGRANDLMCYIFESVYPFADGWNRTFTEGVVILKIRRKCAGDNKVREVLDVPYYPQQDDSVSCVPCSLMMSIEYYRQNFENGRHGRFIPQLLLDEIAGIIHCRHDDGAAFRVEYGRVLSEKLHPLQVRYTEKIIDCNDLGQRIANELPTVVMYDSNRAYFSQFNEYGMGHASVVIGIDNNAIVLHDPNEAPYQAISRRDFEAAWMIERNRSILMDLEKYQTSFGTDGWIAKPEQEATENGS